MFSGEIIKNTFFIEHLWTTASGRAQDFTENGPPNDISKVYYQKVSVICFLRSAYGRFMEFLIETLNKGFSCS